LERLLRISLSESEISGILQSCIRHKIPIHLGSVSDPFQHSEKTKKITLEYLKILSRFTYPTVISTKGTLISSPEYLKRIIDFPVIVQNSFSTLSDKLANKIESGAPSPSERLRSLEKLANSGIWTSIRLQPFLYPYSNPNDINFKSFANVGIKHVVLEHLRIPTNSAKLSRERLFNALGMNILDEYKRIGIQVSRINFELASEQKLKNIIIIKELVNSLGMTFGSADNEFHHISDMPCCCGLPNQEEFQNYYKGNIGFSIHKSLDSEKVVFDNLDGEWQPSGSISEFLNSDCRNNELKTTRDFLKLKIDNPNSSNSPISFFGIKYECGLGYMIDEEFLKRFSHSEVKNEDKKHI
jgi:DNA repair photolyase